MDLQLESKVALVAGSSRGIGKGIAHSLLNEGARVVITGRNAASLQVAYTEFTGEFGEERLLQLPIDFGAPDAADDAVRIVRERWGGIDCLVANVGTGRSQPGWDIERAVWDASFDANLWPTVRIIRAALPGMIERSAGSIIIIGSIAGLEALPAPLPYGAAKAALANYTANLSRQVASYNVRVNYVAPGNILFPGGSWDRRLGEQRENVERMLTTEVPVKRFGTVNEIADIVAFLASPRAAFITGAVIVADGGQTRGY